MGLGELTSQASSFVRDKYRTAKMLLTDVTPAESLAEEATNGDPWGPDARTMMRISDAASYTDDYWRIVDVLRRRLYRVKWEEWRQSYKALVLLEFLLTHGPEDIGGDLECDVDVIQELGTFEHVDQRGFDWGSSMRKKSQTVLKLLSNERFLREERWKALKVSKEIQGFGNDPVSPPSSSSSSKTTSRVSSFGSSSGSSSSSTAEQSPRRASPRGMPELDRRLTTLHVVDKKVESPHVWDTPVEEAAGGFLRPTEEDEEDEEKEEGVERFPARRGFSFRSFSNASRVAKKKVDRQLSSGF